MQLRDIPHNEQRAAWLAAIVDSSDDAIVGRTLDGVIRSWNVGATRLFGYTGDEAIGCSVRMLIPPELHDQERDFVSRLTRGERIDNYETVRIRKDGSSVEVSLSASPIHDESGAIIGATKIARDITEPRRLERAERELSWRLREQEGATAAVESRFRGFVETAREAIWAVDEFGYTTYVNPRVSSLLGYTEQSLAGRTIFDFMTSDSALVARSAFGNCENAELVELVFVRQDGTVANTLVVVTPIANPHKTACGVLAMITDITQRKAAENRMADALRAADVDRRRLEATLQAIPVGVSIADATGRVIHSNAAASQLWGGGAPAVAGETDDPMYRAWWPKTGARLAPGEFALLRSLRTGATINAEILEIERVDGSHGHILSSAAPVRDADGQVTGAIGVNVDITDHEAAALERERLLATLDTERTRLAMVFERAPAFLAVLSGPAHVFERVNPAYQSLVGNRYLIGQSLRDALPEVRDQGFIEILDRVRETGEPFVGRQVPVQLNRDGVVETRYLDFVYQRLADSESDDRLVIHGVDVTEQVVAVNALRHSEQRLREQFAKLPVPTFLWEFRNEDFILVDLNDAARLFMGPHLATEIGRTATESFPDGWRVRADAMQCLRDGSVIRRSIAYDGTPATDGRTFDLTIGPQHPDRVLIHAVDTTEQTRLANQLRQAQKMEAVGQLAGGVAHDFNNLLTVIAAHSSFLLDELPERDARRADVLAVQQAGNRAAGLTRQLLAFSRKQILKPAIVDLNGVVEQTHRMIGRLLGDDIEVVLIVPPTPVCALLDIGQIEQVLMNLVLNARDAMPSGGRVSIATCQAEVVADSTLGRRGFVPPGQYAKLSVTDTGVGMDAETQARIFEPFFTTKEVGKGTGLGLATVYGIVKQSGGFILVESAPGKGASFDAYFPIVFNPTPSAPRRAADARSARGNETVLLVEDDPAVRQIAQRVLADEGYVVLEAPNAQAALQVCAAHTGPIDAVITDAVMPGMSGVALLHLIRLQRPGCKNILMSGYTDDEMTRRGISSADVSFVQKPFTPPDFARHVRRVLDGA